jgi:hypothetical protein
MADGALGSSALKALNRVAHDMDRLGVHPALPEPEGGLGDAVPVL